ncbi:DUF559 domain-containing protein [Microbacterium sp. SD291]|uniref:DUF559 domain-containing protein n=1 Tax=Microbacterium sp. SD291 TaxID=2782007 RepID=UPI001A9628E2|nr:DUF559 domain-containing protein [Microbacterium sp. SD291]MBO0981023.1 DUF559 domain-containing protein [Microbacterium sp. SD291]
MRPAPRTRQFTPSVLLERLGGVARGTLLQRYGYSRRELAAAVSSGSIRRVRQGVFALPGTDPKIVAAAAHGGALTCAAALRAQGIWVLAKPDSEVHVWLGEAGRRHPHVGCACITHSTSGRADLGLAPIEVALVHLYRCHDEETFFAAYESAWNKRMLSTHARAQIRRALPRSAAWMLDLARADAQSGLESVLRIRLHLLGLRLDAQVQIPEVGRVDFVIGGRVILEADGEQNHGGGRRHDDLMRDAKASALGYETLRFDYDMILRQWDVVVEAIIAALGRAAS